MIENYYKNKFVVRKLTETIVNKVVKRTYRDSEEYSGSLIPLNEGKVFSNDQVTVVANYRLFTDYGIPVKTRDILVVDGNPYEVLQVIPDLVKQHHLELLLKEATNLRTT